MSRKDNKKVRVRWPNTDLGTQFYANRRVTSSFRSFWKKGG